MPVPHKVEIQTYGVDGDRKSSDNLSIEHGAYIWVDGEIVASVVLSSGRAFVDVGYKFRRTG